MADSKRLRVQAELQSLYTQLSNLREREADYFQTVSGVPAWLLSKIDETRRNIFRLEDELQTLDPRLAETTAKRLYREAYDAEIVENWKNAEQLYRQSERHHHPDAESARHSLRQRQNAGAPVSQSMVGWLIFLAIGIVILALIYVNNAQVNQPPETPVTSLVTATLLPLAPIVATATPTLLPTYTPKPTSLPVVTISAPAQPISTPTPFLTPSPTPVLLRQAPKMIGPQNNLVWQGGAIVFYFEDLDLAPNELYCLDTLRGYDKTLTENWSKAPVGSKAPTIPVEANVFVIAQSKGMQCVTWSAYIGQETCDAPVSQKTGVQIIGLPDPCRFN